MQKMGFKTILLTSKPRFIDFVLGQYIKQGVDELSQEKLKDLIGLKYQSIHDASLELGNTSEIRQLFVQFQQYLYQPSM